MTRASKIIFLFSTHCYWCLCVRTCIARARLPYLWVWQLLWRKHWTKDDALPAFLFSFGRFSFKKKGWKLCQGFFQRLCRWQWVGIFQASVGQGIPTNWRLNEVTFLWSINIPWRTKNIRKLSGVVFGSATRQWLRVTTRRRRNRSPWRSTKPLTGQKRRWQERILKIITFWFRFFLLFCINIFAKVERLRLGYIDVDGGEGKSFRVSTE